MTAYSQLRANERGSIAVLTAVSMMMLVAVLGFGYTSAQAYAMKNQLGAVADLAAKSAALEIRRGVTSATVLSNVAQQEVTRAISAGLVPSTTTVVTAQTCDLSSTPCAYASSKFYEVILSATSPGYFAMGSLAPRARAVAGASNPGSCLTTLQNMQMGNSQIDLTGCGVSVGGTLTGTNPNAGVGGTPSPPVVVTGACIDNCARFGDLTTLTGVAPNNPYSSLAPPTISGSCIAGTAATLTPGCYSSVATSVYTLQSGGQFKFTGVVNAEHLTGNNVLVYMTSTSSLTASNNSYMTLSGWQGADDYNGIALYSEGPIDVPNQFTFNLTGVWYGPTTDIVANNSFSLGNTSCSIVVIRSLDIRNGNGSLLRSDGCFDLFSGGRFLSVAVSE